MIRLVSGLVSGLAIGWAVTGWYYGGKIAKAEREQLEASHERNLAFAQAAQHWQGLLDDANSKPAAIPERVFVKTDCVPATGNTTLDDGAGAPRAELARTTVQSVAGVIEDAEAKYRACSHRLRAFQDIYNKE